VDVRTPSLRLDHPYRAICCFRFVLIDLIIQDIYTSLIQRPHQKLIPSQLLRRRPLLRQPSQHLPQES
jgi:hypothetical protein